MDYYHSVLFLPAQDFLFLFQKFGPSLGLWRAAEVAALRDIARRLQVFEPPILDLGCGDGLVTSLVFKTVAIGLDPDAAALARAAELSVYERSIALPMETAGLADNSLGTIVSNSVLEHIAGIDAVLERSARALKRGGRLVFTCPTEAFSRWLFLPMGRYAARRNQHYQHLNLWSVEDWDRRLVQAGLMIECVRPYLRRRWVWEWDALELLQLVYIGKRRAFGLAWRSIPARWLEVLARRASTIDLSANAPGGGQLIVARKN